MNTSAGLLLYRSRNGHLQVLLAHPGGPYWRKKDQGAWTLPKGKAEEGETLEQAARREFREETGAAPPDAELRELGSVRLKSGKIVHAWAVEGDFDPERLQSEPFEMEWPPRSGRRMSFPEIDRVRWFDLNEARRRLNAAQAEFIDRLESLQP